MADSQITQNTDFKKLLLDARPIGGMENDGEKTINDWIVFDAENPTNWLLTRVNKFFAQELVVRWNHIFDH